MADGERKVTNNALNKLNQMIGLERVKDKVNFFTIAAKKRKEKPNLNFAFVGNPGTGKTEVARLFAEILYESGITSKKKLVEVSRANLIGRFIGESERNMNNYIEEAMGGVLFIDEAYSLFSNDNSNDFGKNVVQVLLKEMEDKRGKLCFILAGYPDEMHKLFSMNSGFRSRIPEANYIEFDDYNEKEIRDIAKLMIKKDKDIGKVPNSSLDLIVKVVMSQAYKQNFDNARCVRNTINAVMENQIIRTKDDIDNHDVIDEDVLKLIEPTGIKKSSKPAFERLNELIGLKKVKDKIVSFSNTARKFRGTPDRLNLHMVFLGNPGTGKTEVAKLIAEIFYEAGVLPLKNYHEVDASGLIAPYVGQTMIKTHELIQRSLGGVLFIDEAYSLTRSDFGKEAIDALLKDMEEYRGKFALILAGYNNEMQDLFNINPGFRSRIPDQNYIIFEDYSLDELMDIADLMVKKDGYYFDTFARDELRKVIKKGMKRQYFDNARYVRNVLEAVESKQNTRTVEDTYNTFITYEDVKAYEDELFVDTKKKTTAPLIGFEELLTLPLQYDNPTGDFLVERTVAIMVETPKGKQEGTGFIIAPNGYIATNYHVIKDYKKITVKVNFLLNNGNFIEKEYIALMAGGQEEKDVAIIKIDEYNLPYFTLLAPYEDKLPVLSNVVMAGYPLGQTRFHNITITKGYIQSYNEDNLSGNGNGYIYLDLSGTHGNSGGAVVDPNSGRAIGIFSGASIDKEANASINFAIPVSYIWDLLVIKEPSR